MNCDIFVVLLINTLVVNRIMYDCLNSRQLASILSKQEARLNITDLDSLGVVYCICGLTIYRIYLWIEFSGFVCLLVIFCGVIVSV